jgi:hypothetical protein
MIFESTIESVLMGAAEIWGLKEQEEVERVQEIYFRGVAGVDLETSGYIMREECKRNRLRVKASKRKAKDKMDGREECRILTECWREKKKNMGKKEREILPEERICQWRRGKIKSKRKMDECRAEWQSKKEGRESKNPDTIGSMKGVWQRRFRSIWERECERKRWWREKTGIGPKEGKKGAECAARRERQLSTRNEREREWGEILNKDGREIGWIKLISKRRYRMEKERGGVGKKDFLELFL